MSRRVTPSLLLAGLAIGGILRVYAAESNPGECLWKFAAPQGRVQNIVYPIVGKDRAFMASGSPTQGMQNFVYALDLKNGAVLWETDLGDQCCAEPALAGNRLIVTSTDRLSQGSTTFCLDSTTGKILWQRQHGEWLTENNGLRFRPVICGEHVVMVSTRKESGTVVPGYSKLICLELYDGYPLWSANEENTGWFTRLSDALDGRVYFGMTKVDASGRVLTDHIYSFMPATGKFQDEFAAPGVAPASRLCWMGPVIEDGKLYIKQDDGVLKCFDLTTKKELWSAAVEAAAWLPVVRINMAVVASPSGALICLNSQDGREVWRQYVDKFVDEPIIHNAQVIVATRQTVTALRLDDGSKLWQYDVPKPALAGRPCAAGCIVLVPAAYTRERFSLYALKTAEKLPAP